MSESRSAPPLRLADRLDACASLTLLALCACWGVNQTAIKVANAGISPIMQAGLRSLLSGVLVFLWAHARGLAMFERDRTFWPGLVVGSLFALEFLALYTGLDLTTASRGVVFFYMAPFVVAFGAHYFVEGDRLNLRKAIGLSAALSGLAVAMGEGLVAPGRPTLVGDLLCVLAAVMWAATTLLVRITPLRRTSPEKTLAYQLGVSGIILPAASSFLGEKGITSLSVPVMLAFAYTSIVVAFISYVAWFWLVRNYPPTLVSSYTFLSPVFGVIAGHLALGEAFTLSLAVALALLASGIFLVNAPRGG
jgi:drug/metabolite transporter (DMT)-like permease